MRRVPAGALARLMEDALRRRGLPEEHVACVVDGLVETSLRGIDTHGVRLFPTYIAELDGGRSLARPEFRWSGRGAVRVLDAGHALGLVAGRVAADEAARLARDFGVGAVAVRSSNHFGAASVYTLEMARRGVLGLSFTNSDALVAPHGGLRPVFGTNPISLAARGLGEDLFCADFATSQVSYSKVKHHRAHGIPLEPGWAVEDADAVAALKPLGGHKGQCLGMMVEILCAVLAGMPLDHELSHLYEPPYDEPRRVAHFFIALDVAAFREPADFQADLSRLLARTRSEPGAPDTRVMAPGDPEEEAAAERRVQGIPMDEEEWRLFEAAALS
ncbi:MAG TPA: Ldh family oxidoreductase [Thermoanaerobaculia bacterium]